MEIKIKQIILDSLSELYTTLPESPTIEINENTQIYGKNSGLNSLNLVNLIVDIEEKINTEYDANIMLIDERAMSQTNSPFKNVQSLLDYIIILLKEQSK